VPVASIARVLVVSPLPQLDRLFDYRIPDGVEVVPGARVRVPLRTAGRVVDGFVVDTSLQVDYPGPLSDLDEVVSAAPVLRPEVWALARAVADRAAGSASDVLRIAIPGRQVRVEKAWLAARAATAEAAADGAPGDDAARPGPDAGARSEVDAPPPAPGFPVGALERIVDEGGRAALQPQPGVEALPGADPEAPGPTVGRWAIALAHAAARSVAGGRSAIVAVPDYRDVEQVVAALGPLLPDGDVVRWDARQSGPDRYRGFLRAIDDRPAAIVGTRSVVYAPAARLGLIALWDDGDPLLAEPLAPYVHARDAALVRREQQGAALILGGHTRTTETQRLVELGWLEELRPQRPAHPRIIPTEASTADDAAAAQARIPSLAWRTASDALRDGPVLVQVGRPGFAPGLACGDCGEAARCRRCGGPLRQRRQGAPPQCLWCGVADPGWRCPTCRGGRLRPLGRGSVRTAEELGRAFPRVRVIVSDGDRPVTTVGGAPALVIATRGAEPIAEGGYRAVLLLDGDRMVAREHLRVAEDCLRWWSDAAALAADDAPVVLVGVGGRLARALATWRQADFARAELADRRELRFPPAVRVATITGADDAVERAIELAVEAGADALGPTGTADGARAILRVDYAHAGRLAEAMRGEVVRLAGQRRKPTPGRPPRGRQPVPLRVRFDDPDPFAE
jgi:primosomal protein N' (replication factor Y) (superfamily II helicase)